MNTPCTLITGATSGIGAAITRELAATRPVWLHGRNADALDRLAATLPADSVAGIWVQDFTAPAPAIRESLAAALAARPDRPVTHWVHAAALTTRMATRLPDADALRDALQVSLLSASAILATLASRQTNAAALRSVLHVSSVAATHGVRGLAAYAAAKAALDAYLRCAAVEHAPRIRFNSLLPGAVRTDATAADFADPAVSERLAKRYPLGPGSPEQVARAVCWLLSDENDWMTGQSIPLDGGLTLDLTQ